MATAQVDQTQTVTTPDDATETAAADRAPETLDLPQAPARTLPPEASVRHASDGLGAIEIGEDDSTPPADNTQVAGQRRVEAEGQVGEADSAASDGMRSDANDGGAQATHTRPNAGPQGHAARSADGQHAAVEGVGSEVSPQAEVDTESETATTEAAPRTTHRADETPAADLARRTTARVTEPLPETDNSQTQAQTEAASEDDTVYDGGTLPEVVVPRPPSAHVLGAVRFAKQTLALAENLRSVAGSLGSNYMPGVQVTMPNALNSMATSTYNRAQAVVSSIDTMTDHQAQLFMQEMINWSEMNVSAAEGYYNVRNKAADQLSRQGKKSAEDVDQDLTAQLIAQRQRAETVDRLNDPVAIELARQNTKIT